MEEGERILPSSSGSAVKSGEEGGERGSRGCAGGSRLAREWSVGFGGREVRRKKLRLAEKVHLVLECPKEIVSDTFRGVPKFGFNVYVFDFKGGK